MTCFETCTVFVPSVMIAYKLSVRRNVLNAQKVPEIKLTCYVSSKKLFIQIYLEIQYLLAFQKISSVSDALNLFLFKLRNELVIFRLQCISVMRVFS